MTHPGVGPLTGLAFVLIIGNAGSFQWKSATVGTHHQAGKFDVTLPAGGSGPDHDPQHAGMAPQAYALNNVAWAQDSEGFDAAATGRPVVLDDAPGTDLPGVSQVRFARSPENRDRVR
jgi:hypothetical protein